MYARPAECTQTSLKKKKHSQTGNEMRLMTRHAFELKNGPLSACDPHTHTLDPQIE